MGINPHKETSTLVCNDRYCSFKEERPKRSLTKTDPNAGEACSAFRKRCAGWAPAYFKKIGPATTALFTQGRHAKPRVNTSEGRGGR
jgi:hypothetical protein